MSVTIDILFAGLIAFVPNSSDDPSFMTAYLLNAPHHVPRISFYGKVCFSTQNGVCREVPVPGGDCSEVPGDYEQGTKITCPLGDTTDILVEPEIEQRQNFLRSGPRKDAPENLEEYSSDDWLLRVANVERVAGHVKSFGNIESLVEARFKFGWSDMRTCDLDGSEATPPKIRVFGFKGSQGYSSHRQAVAEQVMFTANIRPGPIVFTIQDRRDPSKREFIRANCSKNHCLTLNVENSMERPVQEHFVRYYDFVREPSQKRKPDKYIELPAPVGNPSLVICGLALLRPIAPEVVGLISEELEYQIATHSFLGLEGLRGILLPDLAKKSLVKARSVNLTPRQREIAKDIFLELLQLQDRIVCPPVVMEP